jgi:hypothetical protein
LRALLGDGNDLKAINDLIIELKKEAIEKTELCKK